ncbi:MAG: hypothetical protein KAX26_11845, partial [Anaerolineae bacterium]|nr:hypothetical protein [Anaerolineae bacterium]
MVRRGALEVAQRILIAVMIAIALAIAYLILQAFWSLESRPARSTPVAATLTPTVTPTATR